MKSLGGSFFLALLFVLYFCNSSHAIYDPRETHTVKPPKRYEFGLPWYLSSGTTKPPIDPQVSGWDESLDSTPRNPVIVNDGSIKYRPQYESSNGEIEQQSITDFQNNYNQLGQETVDNFDFQQTDGFDQANVDADQNYEENGWFSDNDDIQEPYEDFAIVIKKPYKDTKDFTTEPVDSIKVAKYDSATGAQCPTPDATGQFVYPPDCKFFVNCWNGRAFVQPCAPGTLFNPETLECDFPIKVKCYGTELEDLTNIRNVPPLAKNHPFTAAPKRESSITAPSNDPSCPPWVTGLLPHPHDCTKYLQCANGGTFIMDCGPGTVFNPAISICDWPYNVKGCGDAPEPEVETTTIPMRKVFDERGSFQEEPESPVEPNVVTCPDAQEGLLPHPSDCKKYLQCSNGNTYVMDCGPGTVFNPVISVCDFPYNVEGCGKAKSTVTEHPQSGINSYGQNLGGQNLYVDSNHRKTTLDHTAPPNRSPSRPPINPNFHIEQNYEHNDSNNNYPSHGSNYPNQNYGEPTQGSHHIPFNGNWDTYHQNNPNQGQSDDYSDSEGSYSHVTQPYTGTSGPNIYVDSNYNLPDVAESSNGYTNRGRDLPATNPIWIPPQPSTTTESITTQPSWNQEESNVDRPGKFKPSTWRGDTRKPEHPLNIPVHRPWLQGKIDPDSHKVTAGQEIDSKLDQWAMRTNLFHKTYIKPSGTKTIRQGKNFSVTTTNAKKDTKSSKNVGNKNLYPSGIYVTVDGIRGHFITKDIEINQGHSNTRKYGNTNGGNGLGKPSGRPVITSFDGKPVAQDLGTVTEQPNHQHINQKFDAELSGIPTTDNIEIITETYDLLPVETNFFKPFLQNNSQEIPMTINEFMHRHDGTHVECDQNDRRSDNCVHINNLAEHGIEYRTTERNTPSIAIEFDDDAHKTLSETNVESTAEDSAGITDKGEASKPDTEDVTYDREPKLIFENKTAEDSKKSVIMKINNHEKIDLDIFGVELIRNKEEPPFPVSYMPPVEPVNYVSKDQEISPASGQALRLRGGSTMGEGYLEVQGAQPGWGTVCDQRNEWTLKEANVVCRQLGYTRGAEMAWQGRNDQGDALIWIAADSVHCIGNETYFQSCTFTYDAFCDVTRDAVGIRCIPNRVAYCREDEIPHRGFCYHLANADTALNHAEALSYCDSKESKLLDIIDQNENNFISEWLVQSYPDVTSVMTSGFGFTTLNRTLWLWEDSQHAKFRFAKWWPGWVSDKSIPPSVGLRPACVVMKRNFPCHNHPDESCTSDYFFWDIEDCASSSKGHSYVCKRPYNDIGCVYGKGQHYSGKADVTALGTKCLPWGDESVQHYLNFKVVSEEIREKLKEHNYCRNPNPRAEIKPWCFTGPNGQFDYCDIPSCAKEGTKKSVAAGQCKPKHFECTPGECIPSPWICDGEEDCTNGADEQACFQHLEMYTKTEQHRLDGYDVEKWLNTPLKTCALRCKEADFTCRSFSHKADGNICLLSDSNVGLTGALQPSEEYDYYEMNERSIDCSDMFVCGNQKCINQSLVCNGKNNCGDRADENICDLQDLGYEIRLSGSNNSEEGRVEVKAWGHWGQVCDDGFGMIAASVACKELGFPFGAREVRSAGFYSKGETASFLMDQIKCRGNETSLRECDFDGWGVHNCLPDEAVGIVCKTAVNTCPDGSWKCDNSPECIPTPFICDEVVDCGDGSDEGPEHCEAPFELRLSGGDTPLEGRVEVRHHGIWGTVCDDDFSKATATVVCRSLGYGGSATALKNGAFGPGEGPIWLDEVSCSGNETQLYRCDHEPWGRHNCGHDEDAGVRCEYGEVIAHERSDDFAPDLPEIEINDLLPADCGMRFEDFDENDEYMARVVQGSIAPKGAYPWQASLRVRGHSRSSHWCGAVVISPLHVLTAAHCLEGYNKGMYFVRAGDFNTEVDDGTEVEANIEDYYIHEDFRKGQRMNNDIALVLLKGRGIPLGRNIMPICLPPENVEYLPGLNCTISGWGSIESGKSVQSNFLRFGWVPIIDQSVCLADYVYGEGAISDGMVCAGYLNEGVDSCDGDSGGPLACYHNNAFTLYGLTSWGKHCGAPNKPGVYVRIGHYRRWIDRKIQESLSGR